MPKTITEEGKNFHSLSIKDLLEARDAYHVFLTRKKNVIGTAIGKYRCRIDPKDKGEKTLSNTEVRNYSWPCILVFVKEWIRNDAFSKSKQVTCEDFIPSSLYLPDGREIPVCVIKTKWAEKGKDEITSIKYPGSLLGGGYPIRTLVQGSEHLATLGCLVGDGRLVYGLTNTHVTGKPGEIIYALQNAEEKEIGKSSSRQLQKKPFSEVYEGLPGKHAFVNLDIGLIEFENIQNITSQVFGIGEVNGIADINHDTLSLKLIGCPVKGYGCVSGLMSGEIIALFYRYQSSGGYDLISDYLVGPRKAKKNKDILAFVPHKGDSGTLLIVDDPQSSENKKAIGILWGGQKSIIGNEFQPYALVTNIGTICRMLDVELISDWNNGYDTYFGAYAHVTLPSLCIKTVNDIKLKTLIENNSDLLFMQLSDTEVKQTKGLSKNSHILPSDFPDLGFKMRGGKYQRPKEGPNHFADMDQKSEKYKKTLLDLCDNENFINPKEWLNFYKSIGAREKGSLPFRIGQIFDSMLNCRSNDEFLCAAGILSHYVFDACMPLHISYMHHGDPNGAKKIINGKEQNLAYKVHEEFDAQMVEFHVEILRKKMPLLVEKNKLTGKLMAVEEIKSAKDAAVAAVQLMRNTVEYTPPKDIVKDFEEFIELPKKERIEKLWEKYGDKLMQAMCEGVILTGRLWMAAWKYRLNKDDNNNKFSADDFEKYYSDKNFLASLNLEEMANLSIWS